MFNLTGLHMADHNYLIPNPSVFSLFTFFVFKASVAELISKIIICIQLRLDYSHVAVSMALLS